MTEDQIDRAFQELFQEFDEANLMGRSRPLLAHYTTIETTEKILTSEEVWFSHPLMMNDLHELRFGFQAGAQAVTAEVGSKFTDKALRESAQSEFSDLWRDYDTRAAFDIYVFCLSEHDPSDADGSLAMWRAYGGQGNGAAIVFDTSNLSPVSESPLGFFKVRYMSNSEREDWIRSHVARWCEIVIAQELGTDDMLLAMRKLMDLIKLFALTFKHRGFKEENEWRVIYFQELDKSGFLAANSGYVIGGRGVEPKLKLQLAPIPGVTSSGVTLSTMLNRIILGPSFASVLALTSFNRMLEVIGKDWIKTKVVASQIPLRPN